MTTAPSTETAEATAPGDAQRVLVAGSVLPFADLRPIDLLAAVEVVLERSEALLTAIEEGTAPADRLMVSLEGAHDDIERVFHIGQQYQSTCDSPGWRAAWAEAQPKLTRFLSRWGQSRAVYDALLALQATTDGPAERGRLLDGLVLDMRLSGVGLDGADRERFSQLSTELAMLGTKFAQTSLDARKSWTRLVTDPTIIDGMPLNWRRLAASAARADGHDDATPEDGPWRVSLDHPIAGPVLAHARNRALREEVRRLWLRVGADAPHDNTPTLIDILERRQEQARLLGFGSYIELSMARKMVDGRHEVDALIDQVVDAARAAGRIELDSLTARAAEDGAPEAAELAVWDERFWSERLREERVGLSDDDLRPYFAFDPVLSGLFALVERLFGVRFEARPDLQVWHPDARAYAMVDVDGGGDAAYLYVDAYARPETKRSGAWMMPLVGRSRALGQDGRARLPAAAICCNQSPPVDDTPSLMSFRQVTTLFHEMGHALHHLLSRADDCRQAGVAGVEWDAVELPSMFLECWVYHRPTLATLARHHQTGEPLPEDVIDRLLAARAHMGATSLLAQAAYTRLDFAVHDALDDYAPEQVHGLALSALASARVLPPLPEDRMLCSFGHLFAGGYAAGYYSYMWAGVLARDAFAAFTDLAGDPEAEAALGRRWRDEVLAPGGSVHPMTLFKRFRGRGPGVGPMLAWYGVDAQPAEA